MSPDFSLDNLMDRRKTHAEPQSKLFQREIPGGTQTTNFSHVIFRQLRPTVRNPLGHFFVAYRVLGIV